MDVLPNRVQMPRKLILSIMRTLKIYMTCILISVSEKGCIGNNKIIDDAMAEFALGDCAMVQNGGGLGVTVSDIVVIQRAVPVYAYIYVIDGEENPRSLY